MGDSHAGAIYPGLMAAFDGAASVVWAAMGAGCGYVPPYRILDHFEDGEHAQRRISNCRAYNNAANAVFASQLQACDVVVVHHYRTKERGARDDMDLLPYYRRLAAIVKSKGANMVILGDTPELPTRGSYCIATAMSPHAGDRCRFSWGSSMPQSAIHEELVYADFLEAEPDVTFFFPLRQLFCDDSAEEICDANVPGTDTLAFYDNMHLTTAGALYLWPYLCSFFSESGLVH